MTVLLPENGICLERMSSEVDSLRISGCIRGFPVPLIQLCQISVTVLLHDVTGCVCVILLSIPARSPYEKPLCHAAACSVCPLNVICLDSNIFCVSFF